MKTTIEIGDELFERARDRARAQGTTLRALVEAGLREVLARPAAQTHPGRFRMLTYGDPDHPVDPDELRRALDEARAGRRFPELGDVD